MAFHMGTLNYGHFCLSSKWQANKYGLQAKN
jgi:hypothetical protein